MRRKILIAQMLLANKENKIKSVIHSYDTEEGFIYKIKFQNGREETILVKPGSTVAIKTNNEENEFETLEFGVPYAIVNLLEKNKKKYHQSLVSFLKESDAFRNEILKY